MIVIKNALIIYGYEQKLIRADLKIESNIISEIGKINDTSDKVIDGTNFLISPGLVNSHIHLSQTLNKGVADDRSVNELLHILHSLDYVKTSEDRYWPSLLAALEAVKTGTTSLYCVGSNINYDVKAIQKIGLRAAITPVPKDDWQGPGQQPQKKKLKEIKKYFEYTYKNFNSDMIHIHFGTAAVRSASDDLLLTIKEYAEKFNTRIHMHCSEGVAVNDVIRVRHMTPIQFLAKIGFLSDRVTLAHMTNLTKEDIKLVAKYKVNVVHCPVSNIKTNAGLAPVLEMQKLGINVALGTDASINNNTNNILNEMYHCTMYHKLDKSDPTVLPAKQVFRMATINGAKAMGINDMGIIEEGKKADLAFYNMKSFAFIPFYGNSFSNLVYNAPNIKAHSVMVDGKFILKNYKLLTIDEEEVKEKVMQLSKKVYDALKKVRKL